MDLAHLRAFSAVAQELHFGRAALVLGLSQPHVSRQIHALEDELGVALFVRTARRTDLTDEGRMLLADARETLAAADRLAQRARLARRRIGGRVAVAFVWSTLGAYLPRLVAAAGERHPEIELAVSQITFLEILGALRRGDVDLVVGRRIWQESEMVERTVRREPSVIALPEGHGLTGLERVPLSALDGEPMVALHRSLLPRAYDGMIAAARERGCELRIVQHARSAAEALALVAAGVGIYRLPLSAAPPHPGVIYRELEETPSRVVLIHHPAPSRAARTIAELAAALFSDASEASNDSPVALVGEASAL
jgi:DNA-binding transcriptional LysR family regulator